ncbi:unnamed protein product [Psylliodes chrysocephalus]|uniref:Uncharacterized protein n=1 Tax=Psylliodes chrysocephalus TaxID=3402493 RepID=A0A9P0GN37_9CUCU|nr:unnamed protein product [Psylliodes chrysocephala]
MKLLILCCVLFILEYPNCSDADAKRGGSRGGGSRSKSSSHSSWWSTNSNKKSSNSKPNNPAPASAPAPVQAAKPSAPKPETKTNAHSQQSGNTNHQPIGWNVPGTNQHGHRGSQGIHQQSQNYPTNSQPHGGAWGNQQGGAWGNHQQGGTWGNQHGGAWGGQQGAYGNQHGGWGGHHQPGYGGGGMGGYGGGMGGYGGGMGGYGGGMGGYGGGMGGFGGGMGGFGGGMGGMGGYGMQQQKRGFFSGGSTFGNILTGMAIYHVTSSLVKGVFGGGHSSRPYTVHNYYNQPPEAREEIKLPGSMLSLCEGNLTTVCTGATSICTTNNTVLCVVTMSQATSCEEGKAMCVNTTIPCTDKTDPICQNTTQQETETTVNMPCYTNLSVDVNLLNEPGAKSGEEYQYCVTTMAVAGPDYKICSEESLLEKHDYRSVLAGNLTYNLTVSPMMRKYQVFNQENPTQAPSGELVLPLEVLIPCIDNATTLCPPDLVTICTGYSEIMCIQPIAMTAYSEDYNTTVFKSKIPCLEALEDDFLCQNKTEEELIVEGDKKFVKVDMPCFGNITVNTNLPNFDIQTFNGSIPQVAPSSFMYHYHFCLITMSVPGPESDLCMISDGKEVKS